MAKKIAFNENPIVSKVKQLAAPVTVPVAPSTKKVAVTLMVTPAVKKELVHKYELMPSILVRKMAQNNARFAEDAKKKK